jgi:hypothetical protein
LNIRQGQVAILMQAPSIEEREASLEYVIAALRDGCAGARPLGPAAITTEIRRRIFLFDPALVGFGVTGEAPPKKNGG